MARLAAAGVLATPERTEDSEERSLSGAGAMAGNDASSSARQHELSSDDISVDNTRAMGQNESREDLQSRNAAIRRAGSQAVIPRSGTGKLPRRSGLGSQVVTGQRRLGNNVLANARTYDVPSDEDSRPRKKQAANKSAFSPLKRQTKQLQRQVETWRASQEQIALDLQLGGDEAEENTEDRREESRADLTNENDVTEEDAAMDSGDAESAVEPIQETEAPKRKRGRPSKQRQSDHQNPSPRVPIKLAGGPSQQNNVPKRKLGRPSKQREPDRQDELPRVSVELVDEPVQQSKVPKRDIGRPSEQKEPNRPDQSPQVPIVLVDAPVQHTHAPKRKRGRPSKAAVEEAEADVAQSAAEVAPPVQGSPDKVTRSATRRARPATHQEAAEITVAGPSRLERPSRTRAPESSTAPPASRRQPRQPSSESVAQKTVEPVEQVSAENDAAEVEEAEVIRPDELEGLNDPDYNDRTNGVDAQPDDDVDSTDGEEGSEDGDEHVDETETQLDPAPANPNRLYGNWHKIHDVMREVARHRGNTVRINDDEFKEIVQACKDATNNVRAIAADVSRHELNRVFLECRDATARASTLCGDGQPFENSRENRKRGFHVFKHLLPALAKLLRAAVEAFERVDVEGIETQQISLDHLHIALDLLLAVVNLGENAHRGYVGLSKPIKRAVHRGITIPLRELHTDLSKIARDEEQRLQDEELEREFTAMEAEREQRAQRRQLELRNQDKWKRMNQKRQDISFNTGNVKKMNHLRSCPMGLVQTGADGQPFLPAHLRDRRGNWSVPEHRALQQALQRHVDTPAPLRSMVFEKVITERCPFRKELADKNLLEIVLEANEMKNYYIALSRERGAPVAEWVRKIPRWMEPPPPAPAGGNAQDVIELD
jgi:hypothetical protein